MGLGDGGEWDGVEDLHWRCGGGGSDADAGDFLHHRVQVVVNNTNITDKITDKLNPFAS